jgi:hypothetical protein
MPTHNIVNKGFSGMRRFVTRFNFSGNLIGNCPKSLTGHIVNVSTKPNKSASQSYIIFVSLYKGQPK